MARLSDRKVAALAAMLDEQLAREKRMTLAELSKWKRRSLDRFIRRQFQKAA